MKRTKKTYRTGGALILVLFIVMAATVLSLSFLSRSNVELTTGQNMVLRAQMDYLAESALDHAKGLVLNPQDIDTAAYGLWTGATAQQLASGDDYYDVAISQYGWNNYQIVGTAYRKDGSETIGRASLSAELRLDPCIAYWTGIGTTVNNRITVNGDVYSAGSLTNNALLYGDVFSGGSISNLSTITGRSTTGLAAVVDYPPLEFNHLVPNYYYYEYVSSTLYLCTIQDVDVNTPSFPVTASSNKASVYYCDGNVKIEDDTSITGTLVVNGDLEIEGSTVRITAMKNFPAIFVTGKLIMTSGSNLIANGLVMVTDHVSIEADNITMQIYGGLFVENGAIEGDALTTGSIEITAAASKAALQIRPTADTVDNWSPAAGAFFKNINRE